MFTGIVETTGIVKEVIINGSNRSFWIESDLSDKFKVDQSVSHSGVCLTVEEIRSGSHRVTAIPETLKKTSLGDWNAGSLVNIEQCLAFNGRVDGHLVQGHVDCRGKCIKKKTKNGALEFTIAFPQKFAHLLVEKGSVSVDGISLTVFNVKKDRFTVAIIPYTIEHTNLKQLEAGNAVNIEFDMIGKYIAKFVRLKK
jgi:riboflavin synthase